MQKNDTMRLPKTKSGYETFNRILATAKQLFSKQGYSLTSINQIIEESNVAAGTFYLHFKDKRAVYIYLLNDYQHQIKKKIALAIDSVSTRKEKERIGIKTFIMFALEDRLSYQIIWESLFVDYALFKNYYSSFSQTYQNQLQQAVTAGEVSDQIDLETLSYVLMGISNFVGLQLMFKDNVSESDVDRVVDGVISILENGMFTK